MVGPPKSLKLSTMFSFYYSFLKQAMLTFLIFPSAFYSGDQCKNCLNEVAGSTVCNVSKGDLLYAKFSERKQLCSYSQSCIIQSFDIFIFFKNSHQKLFFFFFVFFFCFFFFFQWMVAEKWILTILPI